MIDPKRIKLQTLPPGSQQQAPIRQAPRVPIADARRPVKLAPVAYDAADAPPAPKTAIGVLEALAAQAGFKLEPVGRPADVAPSSTSAPTSSGRPDGQAEPTSSGRPDGQAEQYPDPKALEADEFVVGLATFVEVIGGKLPPEARAELEQLKDGLARFAHSVPR